MTLRSFRIQIVAVAVAQFPLFPVVAVAVAQFPLLFPGLSSCRQHPVARILTFRLLEAVELSHEAQRRRSVVGFLKAVGVVEEQPDGTVVVVAVVVVVVVGFLKAVGVVAVMGRWWCCCVVAVVVVVVVSSSWGFLLRRCVQLGWWCRCRCSVLIEAVGGFLRLVRHHRMIPTVSSSMRLRLLLLRRCLPRSSGIWSSSEVTGGVEVVDVDVDGTTTVGVVSWGLFRSCS